MKGKNIVVGVILLVALFLSGCEEAATPVSPADESVVSSECVRPESDNQYSWSKNSCVDVSTTVFAITVEVADESTSYTRTSGSGSMVVISGTGGASYRMWQEGKGLLPVKLISIIPEVDGIMPGSSLVLKTTDLKAMGLPTGAITEFICNLDTEVLSPVKTWQVLTTNRLTYELDDCRMTLPTFIPPE